MTTKNKTTLCVVALLAILSLGNLASAQTGTTAPGKPLENGANQEKRITAWKTRGGKEIDQRIASLNNLMNRIADLKNVSDADRTSITSTVQSLITALTNLKSQIDTDTSTTSLAADVKSITQSYRVYALVEPQLRIIAAIDRIKTVSNQLTVIGGKIQSRLAQDPAASGNSAVQSALSDFTAKLNDAGVQAQAALDEIKVLKPDQGDKAAMQSNLNVLKDARSKIVLAQKDLAAARKDAQSIVKVLVQSLKSIMNASTTGAQ